MTRRTRVLTSMHSRFESPVRILFIPGMMADETSVAPLLPVLEEYGAVTSIGYGFESYDPTYVTEQTLALLDQYHYERLVMLGSSKGALQMLDIYQALRDHHDDMDTVSCIALDGSRGIEHVAMSRPLVQLAPYLRRLEVGRMLSILPGHPLMRWRLKQAPTDDMIQTGLDAEMVKAEVLESMHGFQLSQWWDHIRHVVNHAPLSPDAFEGMREFVYLWAGDHNGVLDQPDEAMCWRRLCDQAGVDFWNVRVNAGHCDFIAHPREWCDNIELALAYVGIVPQGCLVA